LKTKRQKQAEEIFIAFGSSTDAWGKAHSQAGMALLAALHGEDAKLRQLSEKAQDIARQSESTKTLDPAIQEALNDALRRSKGSAK
jgi:hypothetical protein